MGALTLPYKVLIAVGILFIYTLIIGIQGYTIGSGKVQKEFDSYKSKVEIAALKQKELNNEIFQAQQNTNIAAADLYVRNLDAIRKYYRVRQQSSSSSNEVSTASTNAVSVVSTSSDDVLAGQCAETTQQVISIQDWYEEVRKNYNRGIQ